ncbi:hypothetical protein Y032_0007g3483 [Ancylostoma ceylanicum]|uniref:Uncharacterized protein n=1 Tax=Ancylostoma ceylanicum TaxID=53326 RepID=A0A016VQ44_9BILA|nr:hypothetical protein Y032_0007g3483 [Ancylostoma ceylanicum]
MVLGYSQNYGNPVFRVMVHRKKLPRRIINNFFQTSHASLRLPRVCKFTHTPLGWISTRLVWVISMLHPDLHEGEKRVRS